MNSSENQVKRLTVDDIEVPDGMLDAYVQAGLRAGLQITLGQMDRRRKCFAAALLWLAENPIVPSDEQADELWHHPKVLNGNEHYAKAMARDWQRIMFLRRQEELPKELEPLATAVFEFRVPVSDQMRERLLKAYKLGKEGK